MAAREFITRSAEETIATGREIATKLSAPVLVLMSGDLGSGKTTMAKGIISGLGAAREEDVTSPTFTLVHVFQNPGPAQTESSPRPSRVYHVDLYRVENFHDLESLGLEDALGEKAIVIVEWSERFTFRSDWPRVMSLGIYLHGLAGDIAASRVGEAPLIASDLVESIPEAYARVMAEWEHGR